MEWKKNVQRNMWCTPTKQWTSVILAKMSFGLIVRSKLSALIWYQNQVHNPTFWDMTICVWYHKHLLWKCDDEKSVFKVSYFYSFGFNKGCRTCIFFFFVGGGMFEKNLKFGRGVIFHLYAKFISQMLVPLLPCFVVVHYICDMILSDTAITMISGTTFILS